jgi:hypothetical protein
LVIGDGAAADSGNDDACAGKGFASPAVSLLARTAETGWTVIWFDMAQLTANAAPYWRPEQQHLAPARLRPG